MDLAKKLQIPPGAPIFLVNPPAGFDSGVRVSREPGVAVLVFANSSKHLTEDARPAIDAAKQDRISWIAYPKAGQLGTDLHRDKLVKLMKPHGIEGVRMVSIDGVWSAMRFRPARRE
ncbi:MAG TPA: hypothetical protein VJR06_01965 [Nitrososphaerales archaeon]|nr:hypothetical protein [Nitrososphaerales archaeon]